VAASRDGKNQFKRPNRFAQLNRIDDHRFGYANFSELLQHRLHLRGCFQRLVTLSVIVELF